MRRGVLGGLMTVAVGAGGVAACSSGSTPLAPAHDAGVDAHPRSSDAGTDARKDATLGPPKGSWEASLYDAYVRVPDALPDVPIVTDDANCVPPGTASNAIGVGGYCSPGGGQCNHVGLDASTTLCTADFNAPAQAWFCTIPCTTDGGCGEGTATCVPAAGGLACVPAACGAFASDASVDGGTDSGSASDAGDASVDAGDARSDAAVDGTAD